MESKKGAKLGKLFHPAETIIRLGEVGNQMHIIQEGQVVLVCIQEGEDVFLGVHSSGKELGENAIFEKDSMQQLRAP